MDLSNSAKASTISIRNNMIKLAERLVDIVNEYEGLGGMEAELLKTSFWPSCGPTWTVFKTSP
jgi:hypothetical protein